MPMLREFLQGWHKLSPALRALTVIVPVIVSAVVLIGALLMMPHSVALFAMPLESEQLAQVDAQLAAWNVAHISTTDNIEIDSNARNTILLRLSLAGLPHAHIATTNETLAKASALTPDALLEAQSRTGLAGDVAIALRSIDGIADASVVIAPARQATFTDEASSAASASVRLALRPGVILPTAAIDGIRAFVSSAVPFLARDRVVLLDDHGVALGGHDTIHDDAESTRSALQSAFDAAFGEGATIVRVHAVYKERTEQSHEVDRLPVAGGALALQNSDERFKSSEKQYSKRDTTEDHGSIVRDRESSLAAGALDHLSVAVLVDETRGINLEKVRDLACAATGIDVGERNNVRVESMSFVRPKHLASATTSPWFALFALGVPYLAMFGACVVITLAARAPLRAFLRTMIEREKIRGATVATAGIAPREVLGMLAGEPAHTAAAVISALPTVTAAAVLDLYSSEERGAIVARMARQASAFAPTWEQLTRAR